MEHSSFVGLKETIEVSLRIAFPLVIAWLSANVSAYYIDKNERIINEDHLRFFRGNIDKIVINILLPLIFIFAILKSDIKSNHIILLGLGFMLPLLTSGIGIVQHILSPEDGKGLGYWVPFLPATFGGGNRGTLLIMLSSPLIISATKIEISPSEMISYFAIFDLGNFICLMVVIRKYMLPKFANTQLGIRSKNEVKIDTRYAEPGDDLLKWLPGFAIFAGLVVNILEDTTFLQSLVRTDAFSVVSEAFLNLSPYVSSLFAYMTFLSIFILFKESKNDIEVASFLKMIKIGLFSRASVIIAIVSIIYFIHKTSLAIKSYDEFIVATICISVFLILPPSSLFTIFIEELNESLGLNSNSKISEDISCYKDKLSCLVVYTNSIFLVIMFVIVFLTFIPFIF